MNANQVETIKKIVAEQLDISVLDISENSDLDDLV